MSGSDEPTADGKKYLLDSDWSSRSPAIQFINQYKGAIILASILSIPLLVWGVYRSAKILYAPKTISVGVVLGSPDLELMEAVRRLIPTSGAGLRLNIREFESQQTIAAALEAKKLDIAVLRSDFPLPANTRAAVNLREISLTLVALTKKESLDMRSLEGKAIALLSAKADARDFTISVLRAAGVKPAAVVIAKSAGEANTLLKENKIAALAIVDSPERAYTRRMWRNVTSGLKIELLPIADINEFSAANPGLSEDKIGAKSIAVKPAFPDEAVSVLKSSYILVARADLKRTQVASIVKVIYTNRIELARTAPSVNSIKTTDTEYVTSSLIPVHDGALDYFRREQLSFYDRYSDIIWLVLIFGGSVFSGIAWFAQNGFRKARDRERNILRELSTILEQVPLVAAEQLKGLSQAADSLAQDCLLLTHRKLLGPRRLTAITLGYKAVRDAIQRRTQMERDADHTTLYNS